LDRLQRTKTHLKSDVDGAWDAGGIKVACSQPIAAELPHGTLIHKSTILPL
jgi:hypothetical protein